MGHHEVNHSVNVICNLGKEKSKKTQCRTQLHIPIKQPPKHRQNRYLQHTYILNMCLCCSLQFAHLPSNTV